MSLGISFGVEKPKQVGLLGLKINLHLSLVELGVTYSQLLDPITYVQCLNILGFLFHVVLLMVLS